MADVLRFAFVYICIIVNLIHVASCLNNEEILEEHKKIRDKLHKNVPQLRKIIKPMIRTFADNAGAASGKDVFRVVPAPTPDLKPVGGALEEPTLKIPNSQEILPDADGVLKSKGGSTQEPHGVNPNSKEVLPDVGGDNEEIFIDKGAEDRDAPTTNHPDDDLDNEDGGTGDRLIEEDDIHHRDDVDEEAHFQEQYRGIPREGRGTVGTLVYDDLEDVIAAQELIIFHFVGEGCDKCDLFRPHFAAAAKTFWEMNGETDAQVIFFYEVTDPKLMVKFSLRELPTIFFFRSGIPILYEGELSKEPLVGWMFDHLEVMGWDLQENTFDVETKKKKKDGSSVQWIVNFCNVDTPGCDGFMATWESAAYRLVGLVEFGYVDVGVEAILANRFNIDEIDLPAIVLLKGEEMVWSTLPLMELTTDNLIQFATKGHLKSDEKHLPSQLGAFATLIVKVGVHINAILVTVTATAVVFYCVYIYIGRRRRLIESGKEKGV